MHKIKSTLRYLFIGDLLILTLVFGILNYNKFGRIIPEGEYLILFFTFIFYWASFSIYYDKYHTIVTRPLWFVSRIIFWSALLPIMSIAIIVSFTNLWSASRIFISQVTLVTFLVELGLSAIISVFQPGFVPEKIEGADEKAEQLKNKFYITWLIPGVILLVFIYIVTVWLMDGKFVYNPFNEQSLMVLISAWGLSTLVTNRYKVPNTLNHYYEIAPYIKAAILMFLFSALFYFFLRLETSAGNLIFKTCIAHSCLEVFGFYLYFFGRSKKNGNGKKIIGPLTNSSNGQEELTTYAPLHDTGDYFSFHDLANSLTGVPFGKSAEILDMFSGPLKDEKIDKNSVSILDTSSTMNIQVLLDHTQDLLINFHDLNDFRRLNNYLLHSYKKLKNGGLFMGNFIPMEKFREHLRAQMPHFLYTIILPIHFIFHRLFPKLPITKQIYFIITKGRNRILSKAEVFGRLSFCGFEMIQYKTIGDHIYFICKKLKTVSMEKSPSYGPIVKLKRIGYEGEIIHIYKFRTMHPYSEFIQGDIYEKYHLNKSGKLRNDFRITSWGKILRKYFIDELPQIYNWLRGDLNLVGVRALSEHYYSLYPDDLQKSRISFKPGLIPPYYADLPESFNEIIASERKYLTLKSNKSFMTDLIYLVKALVNIAFLGARSN